MKMVETVTMNILMIQAWPKPINYWTFGTGEMIVANDKFVVQENELNGYKFQLVLVIKKLEKVQEIELRLSVFYTKNTQGDFGTYRCISKNSIGQAEEVVELYGQFPDHQYGGDWIEAEEILAPADFV